MTAATLESSLLREPLLAIMDQKHHWAYPALTQPGLTRAQLLVHYRHEYAVYVRDFPVLLARCLGQVPPLADVRGALAENLYEEQTGGISKTAPHPELFLRQMEGLGLDRTHFDDAELHPDARAYKDWLFAMSAAGPWQVACALLTIFVEGSRNERAELDGASRPPGSRNERAELDGAFGRVGGDEVVARHPLVVHYGVAPSAMQLARAHASVEGAHRSDAWRIVLAHVCEPKLARAAVDTCADALARWHRYRDGVAERMGLARPRP